MGRSTTPKYVLEMDGANAVTWRIKGTPYRPTGYGSPTAANLAKFVAEFRRSLEPGGSNDHIAKALGYVPYPNWARIVRNDGSHETVAEWTGPNT